MDISAVRQGLANNASAIAGLNCYGYVPDSISEPAFVAGQVDVDFTGAMARGMDTVTVTCRVYVSRADDRAAQKLLDGYLSGSGASSLKAALEADPTLGGACHDVYVERVQGYRWYLFGDTQYLGAELIVRVIGEG